MNVRILDVGEQDLVRRFGYHVLYSHATMFDFTARKRLRSSLVCCSDPSLATRASTHMPFNESKSRMKLTGQSLCSIGVDLNRFAESTLTFQELEYSPKSLFPFRSCFRKASLARILTDYTNKISAQGNLFYAWRSIFWTSGNATAFLLSVSTLCLSWRFAPSY